MTQRILLVVALAIGITANAMLFPLAAGALVRSNLTMLDRVESLRCEVLSMFTRAEPDARPMPRRS